MHIKILKLSALRGINYFISPHAEQFGSDAGYLEMPEAVLGRINVFCGRNGAGKSTVLDVVRSLRKPAALGTFRRDLADRDALRAFEITFEDDRVVHVELKNLSKEIDVHILHRRDHIEDVLGRAFPWVESEGLTRSQQREVRRAIAKIRPMAFHWRGPEQVAIGDRFFEALRSLGLELVGVEQDNGLASVAGLKGSMISIEYTSDPGVWNAVSADQLPSGWRSAAGLIAWASRLPNGSIATIEEPETHLHPRLQRRVARELARVALNRNLQILASTHSPIFMNPSTWSGYGEFNDDVQVFQVDGRRFTAIPSRGNGARSNAMAALLDELGVLASDVLQANAVVWIEGPSDRIYIKYWLNRWCEHHERAALVENVDYMFCFYGGSVLSHFSADASDEATDAISLLKMNRNAFLIMDRDDDFEEVTGVGHVKTKASPRAKYHMVDALGSQTWITSGYTIETHLPIQYVEDGYLQEEEGRTKIGKSRSKVELARQYVRETSLSAYQELFRSGLTTPCEPLKRLHEFINTANQ